MINEVCQNMGFNYAPDSEEILGIMKSVDLNNDGVFD